MFKLDIYRLLPEEHVLGIDEEPDVLDCIDNPYRIFILETRLYPMIYDMFNNINIYPKTVYNKQRNRLDVYIRIVKNNDAITDITNEVNSDGLLDVEITMTEMQKIQIENKISEIFSKYIDYCLINRKELYSASSFTDISYSYFDSMFEYSLSEYNFNTLSITNLNTSSNLSDNSDYENTSGFLNSIERDENIIYDMFVQPEGLYIKLSTNSSNSDYKKLYYTICERITQNIKNYYTMGVVKTKDYDLVDRWNLTNIDIEEINKRLYYPQWTNLIYAHVNKTQFLLQKISEDGDEYISIDVTKNKLQRYLYMSALHEYKDKYIEDGKLKIKCDNYISAEKIANIIKTTQIEYLKGNYKNSQVFILITQNIDEINFFTVYANTKNFENIYYIDGEDFVFSCLFVNNENNTQLLNFDNLSYEFKNFSQSKLLQALNVKK